jgi:DNA-binding NarL/FixJ family response regulator
MITTNPTRVLIADDNDSTRSGLAVFLEAFGDLKLVGQATNGLEALQLCERVQPDAVMMETCVLRGLMSKRYGHHHCAIRAVSVESGLS